MIYEGRWLTGVKGTERVVELAKELNLKTKKLAGGTTGQSYGAYEPWMCCATRFDFWKNQKLSVLDGDHPAPRIITDHIALDFLHKAFSSSKDKPFGHLNYQGSGTRVERSESPSLDRFKVEMREAYNLLCDAGETFRNRLQALIYHIVPLGLVDLHGKMRKDGSGLSLHHYRGGVFLGLPEASPCSIAELAINLAHELGHQAFMAYQYADKVLVSDYATPVYSAVRKTERPAVMSFHALVALAYMYEFLACFLPRCRREDLKDYYQRRFQEIHSDFEVGLQTIHHLRFTELGQGIMEEFQELLKMEMIQ